MKPFSLIAAVVFGIIALMQLLRVVQGWTVVINGFALPIWASVLAFLITGSLAVFVGREARR